MVAGGILNLRQKPTLADIRSSGHRINRTPTYQGFCDTHAQECGLRLSTYQDRSQVYIVC